MTMAVRMPDVDMPTDRLKLVGWIVRDGITNSGMTFVGASQRWPMSLPTLNRLMATGNVGLRFYRVAEKNLGLPHKLLDHVAAGDVVAIRAIPEMDENLRTMILAELGADTARPEQKRRTRR